VTATGQMDALIIFGATGNLAKLDTFDVDSTQRPDRLGLG
jgi:hypothetical protein